MKTSSQKRLWLLLAAALALSLAWEWVPLGDASARLDRLPLVGLGFAGREVPLSAVEAGVYRDARVVKRIYQAGSQRTVAIILDGSRNRHAIHDPAYCFHGAGWTTQAERSVAIPGGEAKLATLVKNGQVAEAVYWFSDGRRRHASAPRYWWQTTLRRVTLGRSGAEPVLVVLQPVTGETVRWDDLFRQLPALFDL